jgi:hypothetical protein
MPPGNQPDASVAQHARAADAAAGPKTLPQAL